MDLWTSKWFCDAGHEVLISGSISEDGLRQMISNYKPDLIITMGHTLEHTREKQLLIRKYVKPSNIPHIYWATEDPGYTFTFSPTNSNHSTRLCIYDLSSKS